MTILTSMFHFNKNIMCIVHTKIAENKSDRQLKKKKKNAV